MKRCGVFIKIDNSRKGWAKRYVAKALRRVGKKEIACAKQ